MSRSRRPRRIRATTVPMGESELRALSARVWHDHGIVCLRPETLVNDFDRQAVVNAAEKLYGKRDVGDSEPT